jgi:hypothetical protein
MAVSAIHRRGGHAVKRCGAWIALGLAAATTDAHAETGVARTSATASAQVISPLTVAPLTVLSFGWVTSSARAGAVTVSPLGSVTAMNGAHVALDALAGPAAFYVRGEKGWAYGVTLPAQLYARPILAGRHAADLVVRDFTYRSQNGGFSSGRLDSGGRDFLTVGATLQVPPRTTPGFYAVTVPVTVDYH